MARATVTKAPVHLWLTAPIIALALFFAPIPAWAVEEYYSRDVYPWLQRGLTTASNLVDLALIDLLIAALFVLLLFRVSRLAMLALHASAFEALSEAGRRALRAVGIAAIIFLFVWGFNYRRRPLEEALQGGAAARPDVAALQALITESDALAGRLRSGGDVKLQISFAQTKADLELPINVALEELSRTPLRPVGRPKFSILLNPFFTAAGVNGMLDPFVLESIVQPDLVPVERPFVVAHEWAHMAGHGDEAEASAIGWLACMKSTPTAVYSANLYVIMEAASVLPEGARQRALGRLDAGVRSDIAAISRRMLKQNPEIQRAASRVYGKYLEANRVKDGVASYSRALSLIMTSPMRDALGAYGRSMRTGTHKGRGPTG